MPIPKLCTHPACKRISRDGNHKCQLHRNIKQKPKADVLERSLFYRTSKWTRLSRSMRSANPVCELCNNAITSDCDHWLERSIDFNQEYEYDPNNLICLCKSCHTAKTFKLKRLIDAKEYQRIYQWLLANMPCTHNSDYLHAWIKETKAKRTKGAETL